MKLNIFAAIIFVLGFNTDMIMGGSIDGSNNTGGNNCHGDFVSSEFNQK